MKRRIGAVVEADILRRAADEERPLSELNQIALDRYLMAGMPVPVRREAACSLFCEHPIRITTDQLHEILNTDAWDS